MVFPRVLINLSKSSTFILASDTRVIDLGPFFWRIQR